MSDGKAAREAAKKFDWTRLAIVLTLWFFGIMLSIKMSKVQIPQDPELRALFTSQVLFQALKAAVVMTAAPVATFLWFYPQKNWKQRRNRRTLVTGLGGIVFISLMAWWNIL